MIDDAIERFDRALRAIAGVHSSSRASPAENISRIELEERDRRHAAGLMRVNHVGEVCAQALYEGQALTARDPLIRRSLEQAAREEEDHLAWCADRLDELGDRISFLNPLWYAGSLALGLAAGALGDRWSLAFLAETELQVEQHLEGHLGQLPVSDSRSRAIVEKMKKEEAGHRATALSLGVAELPAPVKAGMRLLSGAMTRIAYRL